MGRGTLGRVGRDLPRGALGTAGVEGGTRSKGPGTAGQDLRRIRRAQECPPPQVRLGMENRMFKRIPKVVAEKVSKEPVLTIII